MLLTIIRDSSVVNGTRAFKVVLDGKAVARIKNGETIELDLAPGDHSLLLKIDWCRSNIVELTADSEAVTYRCGSYLDGFVATIIARNNYLYLLPATLGEPGSP
jgi:hypothetical protein